MYVHIMFRDVYKKYFTNGPYTYKYDLTQDPPAIGQLVLCNTRYGVSLGQISDVNVKLINPLDAAKLEKIVELCKTEYPKLEVTK